MTIEPMPSRRDDADPRPPRTISDDVDRLLANFGAPPAPVLNVLSERWSDIVGPAAVDHAQPGALVDGRLRIDVESSAWASQLRWSQADLVRRCAEVLGRDTVSGVDIRVARPR